jgi:hypothetical protein
MKNPMKADSKDLGRWCFVVGLVLAILAGFIQATWLPIVLFILGLIVGFLNVSEKKSTEFLVATIALLLIGMSGMQISLLNQQVSATVYLMLNNFISFVAAAGLVVAIKSILVVAAPHLAERS